MTQMEQTGPQIPCTLAALCCMWPDVLPPAMLGSLLHGCPFTSIQGRRRSCCRCLKAVYAWPQIGDVFNQYWGVVFGEATDIQQKDECEVFRCQADSPRLMARHTEPLVQLCDAWAGGYHPAGVCAGV